MVEVFPPASEGTPWSQALFKFLFTWFATLPLVKAIHADYSVSVSGHYQEEVSMGKPEDIGPLEQSIFHIGSVTLDTFLNLSEP